MPLQISISNVIDGRNGANCAKALPATNIGETSFVANWQPYANAYYYEIDLSTSPTFDSFVYENLVVHVINNKYSYEFVGLEPNLTYYYRVRAVVDIQFGDFFDDYTIANSYSEVNTTSDDRSNLFNEFSVLGYPSAAYEDVMYTQFPRNGAADLIFTRASDGSRIAPSGKMGIVPWNKSRYSNAFSNAYWNVNNNITKTPAAIANPLDGAMDGWKVEATANGDFNFFISALYSGTSQTESIFVKAGTCYVLQLRDGSVTGQMVVFNIANGTVIYSNVGNRWTIEDYGDGWYRVSKTVYSDVTAGVRLEFKGNEIGGSATAGQFCYIYGYQWAESPSYDPLPYIQTTDRLNMPRLDWKNNQPGTLMEGQRTNVLKYSQDFSVTGASEWQYYQGAANGIWANCAIAPDGTKTASRLRSVAGWYVAGIYQTIPASADPYVLSIYAKYDQSQYFGIDSNPATGVSGTSIAACFDLKNGFVASVATAFYAYMEDVGDGWYRCVVGVIAAANNPQYFWIYPCTSPTNYTSNGLFTYIWGAQVEAVKNISARSYASTYIRTFGTTGTRLEDTNITQNINGLIGQTEGAVFVDFDYKVSRVNSVVEIVKTTSTWFDDSILIYCNPPGQIEVEVYRNTFLTVNIISSMTIQDNTRVKLLFTYKQNDYRLYINGVLAGTDTSGDPPLQLNYARFISKLFGSTFESETPLSKLYSYGLIKRSLTNAEAIELTKPYVDPSFDSDYIAILNYAISQSFDLPSYEQQVLQNRMVVDLKANLIWGELDALYVLATDSASNFCRINWKSPSNNLGTFVNSPQKNNNSYMIDGTKVGGYLDTNFNLSTHSSKYTATSCSMICFVPYFERTSGISGFIGANDAPNNRIALIGSDIAATNAFKAHLNGPNSGVQGYTTIVGAEWFHANKAASNDNAFFQDTSVSFSSNPSTANLPNATVRLMNVDSFPNGRNAVSMGAWGANLLNKNSAFRNIWLNYYNAINLL